MRTIKTFSKNEIRKMNKCNLRKHYENVKKKYKSYIELLEIMLEEKEEGEE